MWDVRCKMWVGLGGGRGRGGLWWLAGLFGMGGMMMGEKRYGMVYGMVRYV